MYSGAIAIELRDRGHDVISVREMDPALAGAPDDEVLRAAVSGGHTLVTENVRDYRPLETALLIDGAHHHGIIYTTDRRFPRGDPQTVGQLVRALDAVLRDVPPLRDRSMFLARAEPKA